MRSFRYRSIPCLLVQTCKLWFTIACLLGVAQPAYAGRATPEEAQALVTRANQVTQLKGPDSAPFSLTARIILDDLVTGSVEGDYRLVWIDAKHWREEIEVPGFSQVRAANGETGWRKRSRANLPYRISQMYDLLSLMDGFRPDPQARLRGSRPKKVDGVKRPCVEVIPKTPLKPETICFDAATGIPLTISTDGMPNRLYEEPKLLRGKAFPAVLTLYKHKDRQSAVKAVVTELTDVMPQVEDLFVRPADATDWISCEGSGNEPLAREALRLIARKLSKALISSELIQGHTVKGGPYVETVVTGVLDVDGALKGLEVEGGGDAAFNALVIDVLEQTRIPPYRCDGKAAPLDLSFPIHLRIGR